MPVLEELDDMRRYIDNPGTFAGSINRVSAILKENNIEHALVGALAQSYYVADPRLTKDVDIAIATSIPLESIWLLLSNYGYIYNNIVESDSAKLRTLLVIDSDGMKVDLLSIPLYMFKNVEYPRGSSIPVINRNAIAAMKYLAYKSDYTKGFKKDRYMSDYKELLETGGADINEVDHYISIFKR